MFELKKNVKLLNLGKPKSITIFIQIYLSKRQSIRISGLPELCPIFIEICDLKIHEEEISYGIQLRFCTKFWVLSDRNSPVKLSKFEINEINVQVLSLMWSPLEVI